MVFRVDLERFAETAKSLAGASSAAVAARDQRTIVTAAEPSKNLVVAAVTTKPLSEVKELLAGQGLAVETGEWSHTGELQLDACEDQAYIAAVAYKSRESMPGVWVEAFPHAPTNAEVLKAIYDEFASTGEVGEITFEEFVRMAQPNVLVLTPDDIARFLRARTAVSM